MVSPLLSLPLWILTCLLGQVVFAQNVSTPVSSPLTNGKPGTFSIVASMNASAQQLFMGTSDVVYVVDKAENNPGQINGHPAWAQEFTVGPMKNRPMDAVTNSYGAAGGVLSNGTWVSIGGDLSVTSGGVIPANQSGVAPYEDLDGGLSVRLLDPCDDGLCNWVVKAANLSSRRWFSSVETLENGTLIIVGGSSVNQFVGNSTNASASYELFPSDQPMVNSSFLKSVVPGNLFPITHLLPSGNIFVLANRAAATIDYKNQIENKLDDVPDAVRTHPGTAATAILPLLPQFNYTANILVCGGSDINSTQFTESTNFTAIPASNSCVKITPDLGGTWQNEDDLPEGRVMGSMILLPNGQILLLNGAEVGVAGNGNQSWSVGQSYADSPALAPLLYTHANPDGQRWSRAGLGNSTIPRMFQSSALLLSDGSVMVAGSNPNDDFTPNTTAKFPTELRVEIFYPPYFNQQRPQPSELPNRLAYGGLFFDVNMEQSDLLGDSNNAANTSIVVIRPGFSTHGLNMGQRMLQLNNTYTLNSDGSATLHVSQMPPNPAIFPPGPALMFVVVNGIPSIGMPIAVGSGFIEEQAVVPVQALPPISQTVTPGSSGALSLKSGKTTLFALFIVAFSFFFSF